MKKLITALLISTSALTHAATIDPRKAKLDVCGRFELWHVNGILTNLNGAQQNLQKIQVDYGNAYKEHLITYALAHNPTQGFTADIVQSAKQVILGYVGATWDKFLNAATFGIYSTGMSTTTAAAIAKAVSEKYAFTKISPYQDSDINAIMNSITSITAYGSRKVFVCHSQGNLYCNIIYDKLVNAGQPAQSIGLVGVAVPYSSLRTGNTYVTSSNDVVIDMVRIATANYILPANVTIPYQASVDNIGHKLIPTYLAHTIAGGAKSKIMAGITAEFDSLRTVAPSPAWAPPDGYGNYVSYSWVRFNPTTITPPIPSNYWYYLPDATGAFSGYINGTVGDAINAGIGVGKTCYANHIAEVKRKQALGDYSPTQLQGGCWGPLSTPWAGSWWPYSGDLAPVFRGKFVPAYNVPNSNGSIEVTAGATCRR